LKQLLTNCELFDGDNVHTGRALLIDGAVIADIIAEGDAPSGVDRVVDLKGNLLAPGLIDLQVNGGGGVMFNDEPTVESLQRMVAAHRPFGTTAMLPTLISDDADTMQRGIAAVAAAIRDGVAGIVGIHLEGPHLSSDFHGVHDVAMVRPLDDSAMAILTSLQDGRTLVTVAPETISAATIKRLCDAGLIVFGGHSAATYEETLGALAAGLTGFTHLFNAMTAMHSRAPGMVGAALEDKDSFFGIIADGFHVHPAILRLAFAVKTRGKAILVTDAMPCVGSDATAFELNGQTIRAESGRCLTPVGGLAGSDIGLIEAVRNASQFGGVDRFEALRMASRYPAEAIGIADTHGQACPGYPASLIELDDGLNVVRSWMAGELEEYQAS
jgi:N-acetylglucosamine-6-phosphate deacetylase